MDPEIKQLLVANLEVARENKEMLQKIIRYQKWAQTTKYIYWGIIIFSSVGAYYFIQPYLGNLLNVYTGGASNFSNISDITNSLKNNQGQVQDLIKSLGQ